MLDPRLLRVLHEVARTGTLSAAARELGCSQPAVSQQIRALERAVGSALTVRAGRGVQLTQAGQVLARHADGLVRGLDAAEREVRGVVDRDTGRVRVAAFATACATLLPAAMSALRQTSPQCDVELFGAEPEPAYDALRAGTCDLAVCYRVSEATETGQRWARVPLLADRFLVVLPTSHPAGRGRRVELTEFATDRWMVGSVGAQRRLEGWAASVGFTPVIAHVVDDYVAMQELVAAGHGVGIVPGLGWIAHRNPAVTALPAAGLPRREVFAVHWPQLRTVPAVAAILDALRRAAKRVSRLDTATIPSSTFGRLVR